MDLCMLTSPLSARAVKSLVLDTHLAQHLLEKQEEQKIYLVKFLKFNSLAQLENKLHNRIKNITILMAIV